MLCWCQRAVCSITFIMRHVVGRLFDGTKPALRHARNVICKCAVLLCCCHAEFRCSLVLNLSAVRSTLKVRERDLDSFFCVNILPNDLPVTGEAAWEWHQRGLAMCSWEKKIVYHSIYSHSHLIGVSERSTKIYFDNIFHLFVWRFSIYFRIFSPIKCDKKFSLIFFPSAFFFSLLIENRFLAENEKGFMRWKL